ncbi:hypothetical protein M3O57_10175, partial [Xanthomonas nasturtii]
GILEPGAPVAADLWCLKGVFQGRLMREIVSDHCPVGQLRAEDCRCVLDHDNDSQCKESVHRR